MQSEICKVGIVGAGLAGLAAACKLVQGQGSLNTPGRTLQITIFEKSSHIGGRACTVVKDGFHLNQGAHALYRGGTASAFFKSLEIAPAGAAPNTFDGIAVYGGELHTLPLSPGDMIKTKLFGLSEKVELGGFLLGLEKIDQKALASVPFDQWLETVSKNAKVREFLSAIVRLCTYSNNPQELSAGAAVSQLILSQKGVLYVDNGWQRIVDSLRTAIGNGVIEHLNTEVRSVSKIKNSKMLAVTTDSGGKRNEYQFDHVILALSPDQVARLSGDSAVQAKLSGIRPCRIASLDVCLKKLPQPKITYALGIDEPLYYSVHSNAAKLTDVEGQVLIHLSYYLPVSAHESAPAGNQSGSHGNSQRDSHEQKLLDLLDKLQPGWQEELIYKRYLPDMVASHGLPLAGSGGSPGLLGPRLSPDNLYAVGDFVGTNKFLADAAIGSAVEAAELILQS